MNNKIELAVVIPVYNEGEIIKEVINSWIDKLKFLDINFEIHAYNDGSKDDSLEQLKEVNDNNLIIHDKKNSGHGPTILQGYLENIDKEWVFQIDSDNEVSPDDFEKVWEQRENYDFLIGKRMYREAPVIRKIITFVAFLSVRLFYGKGAKDVNCPFRLMRTEKFKDYFKMIPKNNFVPNIAISGIACNKKFRILEPQIKYQPRQTGKRFMVSFQLFSFPAKSLWQTFKFRFKI